jgi:hypothetical protein
MPHRTRVRAPGAPRPTLKTPSTEPLLIAIEVHALSRQPDDDCGDRIEVDLRPDRYPGAHCRGWGASLWSSFSSPGPAVTPGSHEEGDGRAFVVDDDAAICHSREVFASIQDFPPLWRDLWLASTSRGSVAAPEHCGEQLAERVVMDLSEYKLEPLTRDGERILYRGVHANPADALPRVLVVAPAETRKPHIEDQTAGRIRGSAVQEILSRGEHLDAESD